MWPAILEIIRFCILCFVYRIESPAFYIEKGGVRNTLEKVQNVLKKIYVGEDVIKFHKFLIREFQATRESAQPGFLDVFKGNYTKRMMAGLTINT